MVQPPRRSPETPVEVVLFSGGRGSDVLLRELCRESRVRLTVAINGYDDGLSTGRVRALHRDCLGPSDFRKNATRLGRLMSTAPGGLLDLLERRLPEGLGKRADEFLDALEGKPPAAQAAQDAPGGPAELARLIEALEPSLADRVVRAVAAFRSETQGASEPFEYGDCAVGNIVLGGLYVLCGRVFNDAVRALTDLVGLPAGILENVTDGSNAYLVALGDDGRVLASEAEIVGAGGRGKIREIYLLAEPVGTELRARLESGGPDRAREIFESLEVTPRFNPDLARKIASADLILYSPGTQHSSLFPSYMTPGVGRAIASNLTARKLLVTNLEEDADIEGASAVEIVERALYYLREKGSLRIPAPCLITHYLINDPARSAESRSYVQLGSLDAIDDPRLARIAHYEDAVSGRHDASKVLGPTLGALVREEHRARVAILLQETDSANKISETLVEMVRAGIDRQPVEATVFHACSQDFDPEFVERLPFETRRLEESSRRVEDAARAILEDHGFEYVVLFESSGMYKGGDIVALLGHLAQGKLDAVWGSRRLSVNDIDAAYRLLHSGTPLRAAVSRIGSHVLSLGFLFLYGRYVTDSLSGARVVRREFLEQAIAGGGASSLNFRILGSLLRNKAEVLEYPVHFLPISPEKVRRTTVAEGLAALATMARFRFRRLPALERSSDTRTRPFFADLPSPSPGAGSASPGAGSASPEARGPAGRGLRTKAPAR